MTNEPAFQPALHVAYTTLDPYRPLGDDVLAAVVFGSNTPAPHDPRCVRVDLEPLAGQGLCEVWRGGGPARLGTAGPIRYVENGHCLAGWIELEESRSGGLVEASEAAYRGLLRISCGQSPYRSLARRGISSTPSTKGEGDEERYKLFWLGRARAFAATHATSPDIGYPAATRRRQATGCAHAAGLLDGRTRTGQTLENPPPGERL